MEQLTARSLYGKLLSERDSYLREAYDSALLTIPSIMPESVDALNRTTHTGLILPKPWQSLGARGVNNLASKLLLALLPPTGSFFRYEIDNRAFAGMDRKDIEVVKTDLEQRLAERERIVMQEINGPIRTKVFLAIKHLLVTGNVLIYLPPDGGARVFPLNQFVVRRDFLGNLLELIYVEILDRDTVSEEVREIIAQDETNLDPSRRDKPVHLYTHVVRSGDTLKFHQEVNGKTVESSEGSTSLDQNPWLVLRWTAIDGEDYGRGFVEEYRGDLRAFEELRKALTKAALNAAKLVPLISPSATISARQLVSAENGEPLVANADDVVFLQQQKQADMSVARAQAAEIEQSLAADFLMNSSFQRNGERVTAEEIRIMAQELEDSLGGVYSVQSQELQLPLARRLEHILIRRGTLDKMPGDAINVTVVTGLAAIGRGQDLNRLREGLGLVAEVGRVVPDVAAYLNASDILKRIFIGVGTDTSGLLKSAEEVQAERDAQQQQVQQAQLLELAKSGTGAEALRAASQQGNPQPQ